MAALQKVVVAGVGSVGKMFVQPLLDAGFDVTVLTRGGSQPNVPSSVKVVAVDYEDVQSLTNALSGQDALISTIGSAGVRQQLNLLDAAIAADLKRYIPSEFGSDSENPKSRALPVYADKVHVAEEIEKKVQGTKTTYTFVFTNAFLDFCIEHKLLIDMQGKNMELLDGGDQPFTTTPLPFVAKGVVAVLKRPEQTANKSVRLHGASLTQNQLLEYAQNATGKDGWTVTERKGSDVEAEAFDNFKKAPQNAPGWIFGMLKRAIVGEGYGGDFSKSNDNEMLGLTALDAKEVEQIVRQYA